MARSQTPIDYSQYIGCVRAFLRNYASREYPVEDLVQETFVEAYKSAQARGPPSKAKQWILTIAYRTAARGFRQKVRRGPVHRIDDIVDKKSIDPLDQAIKREHLNLISDGIGELSPLHRQVLEGLYLEDRSCRDLSDRLGVSHDAMKVRLCRARAKLRSISRSNTDSR